MVDANPPAEDAGRDAGPEDAGPEDAGPEDGGPDLGPLCNGPPGLYVPGSCLVLAPGVRAYRPRFQLWSDGTDKDRYIKLPEGMQIDNSDPDQWTYPVGTTIWKTFLQDGVRLETRVLEKRAPGVGVTTWNMRTFAWNAAQDSVIEVTLGAENVLDTDHDIPSGMQCVECHAGGGSIDMVLGFGSIQLNHDFGGVDLRTLLDEGSLSSPFGVGDAAVPGDEMDTAALGYLHSNCGFCHGGATPEAGMDLWLDTGLDSVEETNAWQTAHAQASTFTSGDAVRRIEPRFPDRSTILVRMGLRGLNQMPPLGTEVPDDDGMEILSDWIERMDPVP